MSEWILDIANYVVSGQPALNELHTTCAYVRRTYIAGISGPE